VVREREASERIIVATSTRAARRLLSDGAHSLGAPRP